MNLNLKQAFVQVAEKQINEITQDETVVRVLYEANILSKSTLPVRVIGKTLDLSGLDLMIVSDKIDSDEIALVLKLSKTD